MESLSNPTTPDQGDERRAYQRWVAYAKRAGFLDGNGNAYDGQQKQAQTSWFTWQACEKEHEASQPVAQGAESIPGLLPGNEAARIGMQHRVSAAVVQDISMTLAATPHHPASAEAAKGADLKLAEDLAKLGWQTVVCDLCGQTARGFPSESVAVSGEVSDSQINEVIRRIYGVEGTPRWATLREFARAVLALAGSAKQAAALERMARLDDEMGIEP